MFGVFPRNLGEGISVAYLREKTRSDHVTRNALDARDNEAYAMDKATADSLISVQSFAIISEFTQQDGRKKKTAERSCVTNVTRLFLTCFVVIFT